MSTNTTSSVVAPAEAHLSRVLGPLHLWALAVGLVISGNYFGWSYGMESGGPMGLLIALIPVTIFYVTFMLSYSELATMIPHAGCRVQIFCPPLFSAFSSISDGPSAPNIHPFRAVFGQEVREIAAAA